jgi:hypothetical protein
MHQYQQNFRAFLRASQARPATANSPSTRASKRSPDLSDCRGIMRWAAADRPAGMSEAPFTHVDPLRRAFTHAKKPYESG